MEIVFGGILDTSDELIHVFGISNQDCFLSVMWWSYLHLLLYTILNYSIH